MGKSNTQFWTTEGKSWRSDTRNKFPFRFLKLVLFDEAQEDNCERIETWHSGKFWAGTSKHQLNNVCTNSSQYDTTHSQVHRQSHWFPLRNPRPVHILPTSCNISLHLRQEAIRLHHQTHPIGKELPCLRIVQRVNACWFNVDCSVRWIYCIRW